MKRYKSIVSEGILSSFSDIRGSSLINHVSNSYDIEAALGFAGLYCPELIEVEGCVFIAEFYNDNIESLKAQYSDRKDIEMFVNSWSLETLLVENSALDYRIDYIGEFAKAIQYFWEVRVKEVFPDRNISVIIGEEIGGEIGLTVTLFQE